MEDQEALQMMRRSSDEIKVLRRQIDRLTPQAQAFEVIKSIVSLLPVPSQGMGEDIAWRLDQRIREIEAKLSAPTTDA